MVVPAPQAVTEAPSSRYEWQAVHLRRGGMGAFLGPCVHSCTRPLESRHRAALRSKLEFLRGKRALNKFYKGSKTTLWGHVGGLVLCIAGGKHWIQGEGVSVSDVVGGFRHHLGVCLSAFVQMSSNAVGGCRPGAMCVSRDMVTRATP